MRGNVRPRQNADQDQAEVRHNDYRKNTGYVFYLTIFRNFSNLMYIIIFKLIKTLAVCFFKSSGALEIIYYTYNCLACVDDILTVRMFFRRPQDKQKPRR